MSTPERESTVDDLSHLTAHSSKEGSDDKPPRSSSSRPRAPQPSRTGRAKMEQKLTEFFGTVAVGVSAFNFEDGAVIGAHAELLAEKWAALADENKSVKRVLEGLMETNAWGGVLMATAAVAIPIMDNHGRIPEQFRWVVPGAVAPDAPNTGSDTGPDSYVG